jgi:hypothetical protein
MINWIHRKVGTWGLVRVPDFWPEEYDKVAVSEGWFIFFSEGAFRGVVQRIDHPDHWFSELPEEPIIESDEEAIALIRRKAAEGSPMHQRALAVLAQFKMWQAVTGRAEAE